MISVIKVTTHNRSVYVIASPHLENLLPKEDLQVVGGTARTGSRRGSPPGVTACPDLSGVFANARITKQHHNPTSHHECKNTTTFTAFGAGHCAPPRCCANCTYRRTVSHNLIYHTVIKLNKLATQQI